jgi:MFS family permease
MLTNDHRLYACALLMDMVTGAVVFTVTRRAADMGVDSGTVGLLLSALFLAYTVFAPLMGGLSDRFSRRGLMMLGCAIVLAVVGGCASVTAPRVLLVLMAVFGLALAMYWPPKIAWLSQGKTGRRLAASLAMFSLAYNAGFLLANAGAGALYYSSTILPAASPVPRIPAELRRKFSWDAPSRRLTLNGTLSEAQAASMEAVNPIGPTRENLEQLVWRSRHRPLPLIAGAAVPIGVLALLLIPVRTTVFPCAPLQVEAIPEAGPVPRRLNGRVLLWSAWIGSFASTFIGSGTRAVFPGLASALGIAPNVHGLLAAGVQATAVTTFLLMQVWYGWHGRVWPLLAAQALAATGLLLIAGATSPAVFGAGFLLTGVNSGYCIYASQYYSMELFASHRKGRGSGLSEAILGSGLFLGPLAGGFLGQAVGARTTFAFLAAGLVLLMTAGSVLAGRQLVAARLRERGQTLASTVLSGDV